MLTLDELGALLLTIDPNLTQYKAMGEDGDYTVWSPLGFNTMMSGDQPDEVLQYVQIDRYQSRPDDTVVRQIIDALDEAGVPQEDLITSHGDGEFRWIITCLTRRI